MHLKVLHGDHGDRMMSLSLRSRNSVRENEEGNFDEGKIYVMCMKDGLKEK
jgi:hypothetical protein